MIAGISQSQIPKNLGRSKYTITREFMYNFGQRGYRPKQASEKVQERSLNCRNAKRIDQTVLNSVIESVKEKWSRGKIAGMLQINHETIYRHVYPENDQSGTLVTDLISQKSRRKLYVSGHQRSV